MSPALAEICVISLLLRIGLIDWRIRKIHNTDVFFLVISTAFYFTLSDIVDLKTMLTNAAIATAITLPGFLRGRVGGGDVKLMLALSPLWTPLQMTGIFSAGVLLTLVLLQLENVTQKHAIQPDLETHTTLPLGTAMMIGAGIWLPLQVLHHG